MTFEYSLTIFINGVKINPSKIDEGNIFYLCKNGDKITLKIKNESSFTVKIRLKNQDGTYKITHLKPGQLLLQNWFKFEYDVNYLKGITLTKIDLFKIFGDYTQYGNGVTGLRLMFGEPDCFYGFGKP